MEHVPSNCCSVCQKPINIIATLESTFFDQKQLKICSQICDQYLRYSFGFAHGVITFHVLSKLCENLLSCNANILFTSSLSSVKSVENKDAIKSVTGGLCSVIKRESLSTGHSQEDVRDLKVFFEKCVEHDPLVTGSQADLIVSRQRASSSLCPGPKRAKTCSTPTENEHLYPERRQTSISAYAPPAESLCVSSKSNQNENLDGEVCPPEDRWKCAEIFHPGTHQAEGKHSYLVKSKEANFVCKAHETDFKEKNLLKQNKKNVHEKNMTEGGVNKARKFECDKCNKAFSANNCLQQHHPKKHSIYKQAKISCSTCQETFRNKIQLNKHTASKHQTECNEKEKKGFWCDHCNKEYPTKVRLQRHNQFVHAKQLAVDCSVCGKTFRNKLLLKHHVQFMHSTQTPSDCKVCGKTYRNSHLLKMHLKVVHKVKIIPDVGPEMLQCVFCNVTFPMGANEQITKHLNEFHTKEVSSVFDLACEICGAQFKKIVYLSRHKKKIHCLGTKISLKVEHTNKIVKDKKRYPCDKCGKTYTQSALTKHIHIYHSTQELADCDVCGKTLINAFHLEQHKRQHAPTKICHICGADFKTDAGLQGHLAAHKGTKSHVCEVCGVGFVRKTSWQRHIKLHSETVSYQCYICPKTFTTLYSLNTHMLAKHHQGAFFNNRLKTLEEVGYSVDKEAVSRHLKRQCVVCAESLNSNGTCRIHPLDYMLLFNCNYCELTLNHVDDLCQHLKKHNIPLAFTASTRNYTVASSGKRDDSDMNFTCRVCHKRFQRRENLSGHMKQHKEKAFTCHVCLKKFTYKCNMQNHLRTHSDSKPFQCEVCQKAFKCKQLLNNHRLVHNLSESPFKCQICGKGLTRKFFLQRHYKQMHPGVEV